MSCLGNRLGRVDSHIWGLALRIRMSALPWVCSDLECGSGCVVTSFVLQSPPNNSVALQTAFNIFSHLKLVRAGFVTKQRRGRQGTRAPWWRGEWTRASRVAGREMWWTATPGAGHGGHERNSLLYCKSSENQRQSFKQAGNLIEFAFLKVTQ